MNTDTVSLELPEQMYAKLQALASEEQSDPVNVIVRLIDRAYRRRAWLQDVRTLREQIRQEGGLQVGNTRDQVVERLRKTRQEIFEAEYAHLYR